jgi:hypothetical protein
MDDANGPKWLSNEAPATRKHNKPHTRSFKMASIINDISVDIRHPVKQILQSLTHCDDYSRIGSLIQIMLIVALFIVYETVVFPRKRAVSF